MWRAISQRRAFQAKLVVDRATASRLGITASTIDQTLYDAYGQRQVSTMFTQLNQYHVILEVQPNFDRRPANLNDLYIRSGMAGVTPSTVSGGSASSGSFGPSSRSVAAGSSASGTAGTRDGCRGHFGLRAGLRRCNRVRRLPRLRSRTGGQVPLSAFTQVQTTSVPIAINHQGQFPVVTVSFNLAPKASLGTAIDCGE